MKRHERRGRYTKVEGVMTNIFGNPDKVAMKTQLFEAGVKALEGAGYKVERIQGSGKSSVRRIVKGKENKVVSIRTTQDTWIAFPRTEHDKGWRTLDEVDLVVAVSVDDPHNPRFAKVHIFDGDEMRDRFNRAYVARKRAGHTIPIGRGVWVSLYIPEGNDPVSHVGAGAGLKTPAIATIPLTDEPPSSGEIVVEKGLGPSAPQSELSIAEAKRRLAITFGVKPENIKITVEA
jgi:hypothetical protein